MRRSRINMFFAALLLLSACTDRVEENDGDIQMGSYRLSFAVNTQGGWKKADGARSGLGVQDVQASAGIEMEGKTNGETFYLQTEVIDGFPEGNQSMSRGTQITEANKGTEMTAFGMDIYKESKEYLFGIKVAKNIDGTTFSPENNVFVPYASSMSFFAWYPYEAEGLLAPRNDGQDKLKYIVPDDIAKQQDVMVATVADYKRLEQDSEIISLTFKHLLSAIKFEVGKLPDCTIDSISLKNVGNYFVYGGTGNVSNQGHNFVWRLNKKWNASADSVLTAENETFFMVPQYFGSGNTNNPQIEVSLTLPPPLVSTSLAQNWLI